MSLNEELASTFAKVEKTEKFIPGSMLEDMAKKLKHEDMLYKIDFICAAFPCKVKNTPCKGSPRSFKLKNSPGSYFHFPEQDKNNCRYDQIRSVVKEIIKKQEPNSKRIKPANEPEHVLIISKKNTIQYLVKDMDEHVDKSINKTDFVLVKHLVNYFRSKTKSTLGQTVEWFMRNNRFGNHPISISHDGIKQRYCYQELFRKIDYIKIEKYIFYDRRIYYSRLLRIQKISFQKNPIKLYFYTPHITKKTNKSFYLSIDITYWHEDDIITFKTDIKNALLKYKNLDDKGADVWIFFLGEPIKNDEWGFKVNIPSLIYVTCCKNPNFPDNTKGSIIRRFEQLQPTEMTKKHVLDFKEHEYFNVNTFVQDKNHSIAPIFSGKFSFLSGISCLRQSLKSR